MGRFLPEDKTYIGNSSRIIPVHYLINCGVDYRSRNNPEGLTSLELLKKYSNIRKNKKLEEEDKSILGRYLEVSEKLDDSGLKISNPELYKKEREKLLMLKTSFQT